MLDIKKRLFELSLMPQNSVVIGSGILNTLKIRESNDIDVVVELNTFQKLKMDGRFTLTSKFDLDVLVYDIFEIGIGWNIMDLKKQYSFWEIFENSVVIEGVRYNSLEFLLYVKRAWVSGKNPREKDQKDVELIENYLKLNS